MLDKLKQRLVQIREKGEQLAQENFIKNKVSPQVQKQRYDICLSCPNLMMDSNRCKLCGCFMGVKTWMKYEKCPINKWGKIEN